MNGIIYYVFALYQFISHYSSHVLSYISLHKLLYVVHGWKAT